MMLEIEGVYCKFGEPSLHLMNDGINIGRITLLPEFPLEKFAGVPIFGPDGKYEIGRVTRAWANGDFIRLEGTIRDTLEARYWITRHQCGLCAVLDCSKLGLREGLNNLTPEQVSISCVRIMLPGKSGHAESWVRFKYPAIKYELPVTDKPTAAPWFGGQGF